MRLAILVLAFLLVWTPAGSVHAQPDAPPAATIRGENIWLRQDPAEETTILAYLQRGDQIRVTGGPTTADGAVFYPVRVVATEETGWVRALAIDPRTIGREIQLSVSDVAAPVPVETNPDDERPRRNRNRAAQAETDGVAADPPEG